MKIFISYRRDDSAGYAGRLFDHLAAHFGTRNVFMDIDTIEPGEDFRKVVQDAMGTCDVVLVMMGKHWLNITNDQGQRRLDDPRDWVRVEVANALTNPRIRVIPVLVRDASMPGTHELPDDLKELSWRNAIELSDNRFQYDANELIKVIERAGIKPAGPPLRRLPQPGAATLVGIILGLAGLGLLIGIVAYGIIPLFSASPPTPTDMPVSTSTLSSTDIPATSTPTIEVTLPPTAGTDLSPAIQTMDQYFSYINSAGIPDDLIRAWELLTTSLQCNPGDQCNFDNYRNWWWNQQVQYELYDCGSNTVTVELIFYSRGGAPNPSRKPEYVTYKLIEENGQLKLNSGETVTGVSAYCELAVPVP